ncbi:AraC family transcriptional regulator [Gluconobacter oxydans]|uniref:AraC family transcriptional regulator n=1 Tax=Gluconobacter oxydans TaxID=442 RepID=UPI001CD8535E|nr:AraC family transcriptional regulator [Gluconobacter oxydans]
MNIIRLSEKTPPSGMVYKPSLCITRQGAKAVEFGDAIFEYGAMAFLLVSIEIPALGRVTEASPECPYIGITLDLDAGILREVMSELAQPPVPSNDQGIGVFVADLSEDLADCIRRLIRPKRPFRCAYRERSSNDSGLIHPRNSPSQLKTRNKLCPWKLSVIMKKRVSGPSIPCSAWALATGRCVRHPQADKSSYRKISGPAPCIRPKKRLQIMPVCREWFSLSVLSKSRPDKAD